MSEASQSRLSYYVSELVVIIVGVLIALAVNEWRGGLRDRQMEAVYLQALEADLRTDSTMFANAFLPAVAEADSALQAVAPVIRGGPLRGDTLAFLEAVSIGGRLGTRANVEYARRTTFDELVATGDLSLIRSASVRAALVSYYRDAQVSGSRLRARMPDYPMAVQAYYPGELRGNIRPRDVRAFGVRRAVEGFRSPKFEAVMDQELNFTYFARTQLQSMADQATKVLHMVEQTRKH